MSTNTIFYSNPKMSNNLDTENTHIKKKRGRKPKGGKVINKELTITDDTIFKPSIILHLKCASNDLSFNGYSNIIDSVFENNETHMYENNSFKSNEISSYSYNNYKLECDAINENPNIEEINNFIKNDTLTNYSLTLRDYNNLVYSINSTFFNNNLYEIKSDCFWCHHSYDSQPIHIPKFKINDKYNAYGYFCSLECAIAHLFNENINTSDKFENYTLLLSLYANLLGENKNIIAAPNPYYTLSKYCGNMSIGEFRKLHTTNHKILCIHKPSSLIIELPEIHLQVTNASFINEPTQTQQEQQFKVRRPNKKETINRLDDYFGI